MLSKSDIKYMQNNLTMEEVLSPIQSEQQIHTKKQLKECL